VTGACCGGNSCDSLFGEKSAGRDLRSYLKRGLRGDARLLAKWASSAGLAGATVLDVGGGVGAIQAELVRQGAAQGTVVEVVPAYQRFALELAEKLGVAGRSRFVLADLSEGAEDVAPADLVVLRRVVCCSPHGPQLLAVAGTLTRRVLLVSYPRRVAWTRAFSWAENLAFRLIGRGFRSFIHPPGELEAAATASGLRRTRSSRGLIWQSAAFERVEAP